ncbi:YopX family protein [Leptotrichia sp. HSP-342]|uniref:YopX family protein n=1 Tax=Leptotrichia mesophila TaxID=3239303 RepID=A0AB39VCW1_9FUSO
MTREIKFRAWLKEEKKMVNVETIDFTDKSIQYLEKNEFINAYLSRRMIFDDIELMQFSGLKDANGKEIYENDLISCNKYKNIVVFFENGCFEIKYPKSDTTNIICTLDTFLEKYKCKISGNIYENKNLLEENR